MSEAADGASALERLRTFCPGLVVLDLSLPRMAGLDLLRKVRGGDLPGSEDLPRALRPQRRE